VVHLEDGYPGGGISFIRNSLTEFLWWMLLEFVELKPTEKTYFGKFVEDDFIKCHFKRKEKARRL